MNSIPTAYFILFQAPLTRPFPKGCCRFARFVLSYPCKAKRISFNTGVYCVESAYITFFCSGCQGTIYLTFCGKYYRSSTICKELSTIRLMNAVSWRDILYV